MALILHPLARTTPRTRAELKAEDPSLSDQALARRYGVTGPTVRKWRERDSTADRSHRPQTLHCTLTSAQEAVAMEIRRTLWLPLDDLLVVVREFLNPEVSRSGLARCMKRHGVNQRPVEDKDEPVALKTFKDYAPGFLHVDIKYLPQMADETARRYLFVAIDRATRWVFMRIYANQSEVSSTDFLRRLKAAAPMKIQTLLTDNGSQFTDRFTTKAKQPSGHHAFDRECTRLGIEHRLIKPRHPQTNGMVERFNGRISDVLATTRFRSREDLQTTLERYEKLYNDHLPQRALGHKTPLQAIRTWQAERPELFTGRRHNQAALDSYSIGAIQVDLGQGGTLPLGETEKRKLNPGEQTYVDAIIDQSSTYANAHGLKFTKDKDELRSDLLSHGNGELTGAKGHQHYRSSIDFIDKDTHDSINAWASSDEGKKWIHHNIDYAQVKSVTEKATTMVDTYGKNISEEHRFETICILAKTANQYPAALKGYQEVLEKGGNFDEIMAHSKELSGFLAHYDGPKAAKVAAEYVKEYSDPTKKEALDRANLKVGGKDFDPSKGKDDPDIKEALKAIGESSRPHQSHEASTLRQGMHSESVQKLQTQLGELGYLDNTTTPDSKFGPVTTAAVKSFQHDHHLPEVGQAGPATQHAMQAGLQPLKRDDPGLLPAVSAMSSLPAGKPGLDDPRNALNPDHELYNKLSTRIPDASEQRLLQFTAACHKNQITGQNLGALRIDEETGLAHFGTKGLEVRTATVDIKEPSPPPTQSIQQIQQYDQHQVQINTQVNAQIQAQNAQAPPGPVLGGPPTPGGPPRH